MLMYLFCDAVRDLEAGMCLSDLNVNLNKGRRFPAFLFFCLDIFAMLDRCWSGLLDVCSHSDGTCPILYRFKERVQRDQTCFYSRDLWLLRSLCLVKGPCRSLCSTCAQRVNKPCSSLRSCVFSSQRPGSADGARLAENLPEHLSRVSRVRSKRCESRPLRLRLQHRREETPFITGKTQLLTKRETHDVADETHVRVTQWCVRVCDQSMYFTGKVRALWGCEVILEDPQQWKGDVSISSK